jgi:hypothetical protein
MKAEVDRFLDDMLDARGTLDALFLPTTWSVTPTLATGIYGADALEMPAAEGSRIPLDPAHRRGILSLSGFLAAHATVSGSSPVDRGLFVLRRLLCVDLQLPQNANIPPLARPDAAHTTRQRIEQHAADPRCAACHDVIDPIGFGFEQMDGIGRFRASEGDQPVDSRGELVDSDVDGPFTGPAELSSRLAESREVRGCFVRLVLRWAEGREAQAADQCGVRQQQRAWRARELGLNELLANVVASDRFVRRVGGPP